MGLVWVGKAQKMEKWPCNENSDNVMSCRMEMGLRRKDFCFRESFLFRETLREFLLMCSDSHFMQLTFDTFMSKRVPSQML